MTDIEQVKSKLDIVEVVHSYLPNLKRTGRSWKTNCPFHKEKTGSFIVTPELQRYKCFGCGEGGDALTFIQKMERVEFPEALRIAAEKAGVELSKQVYSEKEAELKKQKERLYELNRLAMEYWHYVLATHNAGKIGRDYAQRRGIRGEEIQKFKLGYAPVGTNLIPFLQKRGYKVDELIRAGLAVDRENGQPPIDKFRDRFILPIYDMKGNTIGFSGRQVTPNDYAPKYLNSPETIVYHKSDILMGLYQAKTAAREHKFIILQEGNIDILTSHKVGVENIVASGGTALTESQLKLIAKYADVVYFCLDTDNAGIKALVKGIELAERIGLKHKSLDIGTYKDPDELITKEPNRWVEVIANPQNSVEFLLKHFAAQVDLGTADGKSELVERMLPVLRSLHDEVQRTHFANQLAMLVNVSAPVITDQIANAKAEYSFSDQPEQVEIGNQKPEERVQNKREEYLIALLIQLGDMHEIDVSLEPFTDISCKEILAALIQKGNASYDFAAISANLSDQAVNVLQTILATDVTDVVDVKAEFQRIYKVIYGNFLRQQILELRQGLQADTEGDEILKKLQYFTKELSELS